MRITILVLLIGLSVGAALYVRLLLHTDIVYTHFMYMPIVLACLWWGRRGMLVTLCMATLVFSFHLFGLKLGSIWNDAARIALFGLVSFLIGSVRDREKAQQKAQKEEEARRKALTELAQLPAKHIHAPWAAPAAVLAAAGVALGRDYPEPIVDLQASRARALERFERIKRA